MAIKGQSLNNTVTSEKITWIETAADTNGKSLRFHFEVAPKGKVAVRHIHPEQNETFEVKKGTFHIEVDGKTHVLKAGESLTIQKGQPHSWRNESETEPTQLITTFTPALKSEIFFEQFFGLCNDGKADANGSPSFLQLMAMSNEYQLYIAGPPIFVQKIMGVVIGGIAQFMGYKKYYEKYRNDTPLTTPKSTEMAYQ